MSRKPPPLALPTVCCQDWLFFFRAASCPVPPHANCGVYLTCSEVCFLSLSPEDGWWICKSPVTSFLCHVQPLLLLLEGSGGPPAVLGQPPCSATAFPRDLREKLLPSIYCTVLVRFQLQWLQFKNMWGLNRGEKKKQQQSGEHSSEGKLDCRVCLGFSFAKGRCNMENSLPSLPWRQWARPSFSSLSRNKKASEVLGWNVWENWIFQHWRWLKGRLGTCLGGLLYFVFTFIFCSTSEIAKCIGRIRKLVFWKCLWYFQSWEWLTENGDDAVVVC